MESPDDNKMECIGSLLVHSQDMQELSDMTTRRRATQVEDVHKPHDDFVHDVNKTAAVGALLMAPFDCDFVHHHPEDNATTTGNHSPTTTKSMNDDQHEDNKKNPVSSSSLIRRITTKLQGPAPNDAEAELWAD